MITVPRSSLGSAIEAVVLFGSKSRGDADAASDTDLAVFANAASIDSLIGIKQNVSRAVQDKSANFSVYSLSTAELMATDGSLFLWHLKLEGQVLFQRSDWFSRILKQLAPYSAPIALRNINTFDSILHDVAESIKKTQTTLLFEAATLFTILRSTGMIVSAIAGSPCFGRLDPIFLTKKMMNGRFPVSDEKIKILLGAKLVYSGKKPTASFNVTAGWCEHVKDEIIEVLDFTRGFVYETSH